MFKFNFQQETKQDYAIQKTKTRDVQNKCENRSLVC